MSDEKIIPFKPRPRLISEQELEMFRHITRNWSQQLRELMLPAYAKLERERQATDASNVT